MKCVSCGTTKDCSPDNIEEGKQYCDMCYRKGKFLIDDDDEAWIEDSLREKHKMKRVTHEKNKNKLILLFVLTLSITIIAAILSLSGLVVLMGFVSGYILSEILLKK